MQKSELKKELKRVISKGIRFTENNPEVDSAVTDCAEIVEREVYRGKIAFLKEHAEDLGIHLGALLKTLADLKREAKSKGVKV